MIYKHKKNKYFLKNKKNLMNNNGNKNGKNKIQKQKYQKKYKMIQTMILNEKYKYYKI